MSNASDAADAPDDTETKDTVTDTETLHALGNEYNPEILRTASEPLTVNELSEMLDIPIATCYRRIEELVEADLLEQHDRVLTDARRRASAYRRDVDAVHVEFEGETISIDIEEYTELKSTIDEAWRGLSD